MTGPAPWPWWRRVGPTRARATCILVLAVIALCRLAAAAASGIHATSGDFTATLPGAYAEELNPALWNGPDGRHEAFSYRHGYTYGPAQYLTLWPIVFLDSYRQIALVLLPIYIAVILAIAWVLWRLCEALVPLRDGCRAGHLLTVFAAVTLFAPLLIAMGQREFEVVQTLVMVLAAYGLATRRAAVAGALVGYIAMFKYWPAALGMYFIVKRQWKAAAAFVVAIALVLVAAQAAFGLARFKSMSRGGFAQQWGRIYDPLAGTVAFCGRITGTAASVQNGVCAVLGNRSAWAEPAFYALLAVAAGLFAWTFRALEKRPIGDDTRDRWQNVIEFSVLLMAAGIVFHAHYYYLSVLVLPVTLLLYRAFWAPRAAGSHALWLAVVVYTALSAFVVPLTVSSRLTGRDIWSFYLTHGVYLYGEILLAGLLLVEYRRLLGGFAIREAGDADAAAPAPAVNPIRESGLKVSIVVPVFRSRGSLAELHSRLTAVLQPAGAEYELLFVDDGCPDGSAEALDAIAETDARVQVIRLRENQGQHRAALIGASHARGDAIVFMDADLQDSPESVVRLIEPIGRGFAAALARRGPWDGPWRSRIASRGFKVIVHALCGIPPDVGMYMAISRQMRDVLLTYRTRHVYLEGMVGLSRLPVTAVAVPRASRARGRSGYTTWTRTRFAASAFRCVFDCAVLDRITSDRRRGV